MSIVKKRDFHYILKPGTTARVLTRDLYQQTDLKFSSLFLLLTKLNHNDQKLKEGEYIFPVGSRPQDILKKIIAGEVIRYKFTIVEGWNYRDLMKALNQAPSITHTLINDSAKAIAQKLNIHHKTPEGLLFPSTYYYTLGTTDLALLKQARQTMQDYMQKAWADRDRNAQYRNSYQALIVASMIERETAIKEEKPIIAAIILKRFQKWIPLQIDASVIYGLGSRYTGKLTKKDLLFKTPYNTFTRYGLPPTPISMPGEDSIQAALHPSKTKLLYFVANGNGHQFSESLKEHNRVIHSR